eukprot:1395411-Amorphochlora_amoeboformis.AAC.1
MVTIIDPHIKRDSGYHVHRDAEAQKLYVRDASGNKPYEGWCWPGSVSYLDFFNPDTLEYWADKFSFDQYKVYDSKLFFGLGGLGNVFFEEGLCSMYI